MSVPNPQLRNFAVSAIVAAAATVDLKLTDASTDYIYVTGLVLSIYTHANAKNMTFQDSTPASFASYNDLTVAAGANQGQPIVYDFGTRGYKLAQGKKLQCVSDSAGPAGTVVAYGYQSSL
jgi:hypothetical protein